MATVHVPIRARGATEHRSHGARPGGLLLPLIVLVALATGAVAYIAYVLWPRWPGPLVAADAPAMPVTIAGVTFNLPPASIRMPVQRRPGAHERIDLAFLWPSLEPPDPNAKPAALGPDQTLMKPLDRVFVTIATAGDTLPPAERVRTIYSRYATATPVAGPSGLAVLAFRKDTPYQGEDLIYDAQMPANFLVRCSRNGAGSTPGICFHERRIEGADLVVRFPRDWLDNWRSVAGTVERLVTRIRTPAG